MKTFNLTDGPRNNFEFVLKKLAEYFKPKVNVIRMRRIFQRRLQQPSENEECYLRALYTASEDCEFGASCYILRQHRTIRLVSYEMHRLSVRGYMDTPMRERRLQN